MEKSRKLHNRDRLSELPDSLIITILSRLEMSNAVRTSVLSKRWKDLWTTVPSLNFFSDPSLNFFSDLPQEYDTYRSFINYALLRWKGVKIFSFDIPFYRFIHRSCDLDSWLLFAIEKQVEELRLWGGLRATDEFYCPPQRLYTCSSIRKLTLSSVKLRIPENVQLSRLTSLKIYGSESLSGLGITRLLSVAPMLEKLALLSMEIVEDFNIRSESLKKLQIGRSKCGTNRLHSTLRIWAPNLSTLEFKCFVCDDGNCFLDGPSLTTSILNFYEVNFEDFSLLGTFDRVFRSIRHAQSVTLSDWCIELLLHLKRKGMSVEFSNAKHLELCLNDKAVDEMLLAVLEMFPKLLSYL